MSYSGYITSGVEVAESLIEKLQKQKSILEDSNYRVAAVMVFGSQNYNLDLYTDEYQSDLDMKAIIIPTLDDLITNSKPVSKTLQTEWGECDVKDIRLYLQTLLKANPSYLETLFTKYYVVDDLFKEEFALISQRKEELVYTLRAQMIR